MNYRTLGRTGLRVSEIGLGALEIGRDWPHWRKDREDFKRPSERDAIRLVEAALDHGINFIDTAPAYVASEEILGAALKGKRKDVILATKCGEWFDGTSSKYDYSLQETTRFIETSLRKLRTDWIDLIQIHSGTAEVVRQGDTMKAMKKAQQEGKVRFLGISVDREDAALAALESGDYDCIQLSYNLLNRTMENSILPKAAEGKIGIIVKDTLAAGRLTPKYRDLDDQESIAPFRKRAEALGMPIQQYALRFVLSEPAVSTCIVGTKRMDHLLENIRCSDGAYHDVRSQEVLP